MTNTSPGLRSDPEPRLVELDRHADDRGVPLHAGTLLGWPAARWFLVTDVPVGAERGGHAHRTAEQLLVCVHGTCTVDLAGEWGRRSFHLDPCELIADGAAFDALVDRDGSCSRSST